jgi:cysteine-rich repeat protein
MRFKALELMAAIVLASPLINCTGDTTADRSSLSGSDEHGDSDDCTRTQGYWKNHPDAWPVASVKLGTRTYTNVELLAIFHTPVKGNGLVQLAHQLIAAKLNIAAGASVDADINASIAAADALIGSLVCPPIGEGKLATNAASDLTGDLDAFNSGKVGPGHCGDSHDGDDDDCDGSCDGSGSGSGCDQDPVCGNGVVELGELCDDGNFLGGDGCSASCLPEPACGNGIIEVGETCDDGNTTNGDGCSSVCICEPCPH